MTNGRLPALSSVLAEMQKLLADQDLRLLGGFSPYVSAEAASRSTFVARGDVVLSSSGGISVDEMALMYGLCEVVNPSRVLVVGNSYGVSTLFLALANPESTVVAIDKYRTTGIEVTNKMLTRLPKAKAIQGSTPEDLGRVIDQHLGGGVDLVLIDAVHENDVQTKEFEVLEPFLSSSGTVIFHDVLSCDLLPSIWELSQKHPGWNFDLCGRTTTGLAVGYRTESVGTRDYLAFWTGAPQDISDFEELMSLRWSGSAQHLFRDVTSRLSFPPHPQS